MGGLVRASDPATSFEAAAKVKVLSSRSWVHSVLEQEGPLTADELEIYAAAHRARWSGSRIRTALRELQESGLVVPSGATRKTRHGYAARVWRLA